MEIILLIIILIVILFFYFNYNFNTDYAEQKFLYPEAEKNWQISHQGMYDVLAKYPYITFDHAYFAQPKNVYFPRSLKELQSIIKQNQGRKIRVSGGHHTFNDSAISNDIIIRTFYLKKILKLDKKNKLITVESGILLEELNIYLEKNNLALHILPAIPFQSIGGSLSTGTHGSRYNKGSMSSAIKAITLVLANGEIKTFTTKDPEFPAVKTSLGTLGAIYSVTLECEDLFWIEHTSTKMPWKEYLQRFPELRKEYLFVQAYYYPFSKDVNNTRVTLRKKVLQKTKDSKVSHRVLTNNLEYSYYTEMEIGVSTSQFSNAVQDVVDLYRKYKEEYDYSMIYPILIRFTGNDENNLISMASDRQETTFIDIFDIGKKSTDPILNQFFKEVQDTLVEKYGGRPHFGKKIYLTHEQMRQLYGDKLDEFIKVKNKLDPQGMFSNDYTQRLLGF